MEANVGQYKAFIWCHEARLDDTGWRNLFSFCCVLKWQPTFSLLTPDFIHLHPSTEVNCNTFMFNYLPQVLELLIFTCKESLDGLCFSPFSIKTETKGLYANTDRDMQTGSCLRVSHRRCSQIEAEW